MDEMTIGEISRSLGRLEKSQAEQMAKLDVIRDQTVKTNGFVGRHEERLNGLDREIRDIKKDGPVKAVLPEGESLSIKISPKMWAAIIAGFSGLSVFAPKAWELIEKLLSR